jgi:protein-S-isoprenylcysteine O-methyltransferase Ste14
MQRSKAAAGSAAFFVVGPGTVLGLIPWLITRWEIPGSTPIWRVVQVLGALLSVAGLMPLVNAFVQFAKAGGTPMPITPPERLVVTGFNRYVRNPMYVGMLVILLGQAMLFGSLTLLVYGAFLGILAAAVVRWHEEPILVRRYGSEYQTYRRNVPAWLPRIRPWTPEVADQSH